LVIFSAHQSGLQQESHIVRFPDVIELLLKKNLAGLSPSHKARVRQLVNWLPHSGQIGRPNSRCSIPLHLLVPGGRWATVIAKPVSSARVCGTRFPLLPPQSAVINSCWAACHFAQFWGGKVVDPDRLGISFATRFARWGRMDFLVHSLASAPKEMLQGRVVDESREGYLATMNVSCWSFIRMAHLAEPLMKKHEKGRSALHDDLLREPDNRRTL
jgi:hypothetical protein